MIKLKGVTKIYNTEGTSAIGLQNVNLELLSNEIVVIIGDSGAGKTTLMNVITGVDTYEEGEIIYDRIDSSEFSKEEVDQFRTNNVGFVFQNYNLIESFSVLDNVISPLLAKGVDVKTAKEKAKSIIKEVGLENRLKTRSNKLSGGEKQRVVLARALVSDSKILACDEPTGNLDSKTGIEIIKLIKKISKDKLVLIVTHDYESFKDIATRKIVMKDGKIVEDQILKKIDEPFKIDIENVKKMKMSSSFYLALKNLICSPIRTLLSSFVFLVQFLIISFLVLTIININPVVTSTTTLKSNYIFKDEKLIYVYPQTDQTIEDNSDKEIIFNDKNDFFDLSIGVDFEDSTTNYINGKNYFLYPYFQNNNYELIKGSKKISSDEEVVICYNIDSSKKVNFNSYINQEISLYFNRGAKDDILKDETQSFTKKLKIVGIVYFKQSPYNLIIGSENLLKELCQEYTSKVDQLDSFTNYYNSSVTTTTLNNVFLVEDPLYYFEENIIEPFEIDENTIYIDSSINISDFYLKYKNITLNLSKYKIDNSHTLLVGENYFYLLPKSIVTDIFDSNYRYRIYYENETLANAALKNFNEKGIYAESTINQTSESLLISFDFIGTITLAIFLLIFTMIVIKIGRNILFLIYGSKKNDYAIYQTIGYNRNKLRMIDFLEILILATILFVLNLVIVSLIVDKTDFVFKISHKNQVLYYLINYLFVFFVSVNFVLKFQNRVFKDSVAKTLKAGDFLD